MAKIVETDKIWKHLPELSGEEKLWTYCGYDVVCPHDILSAVDGVSREADKLVYLYERNLQALSVQYTIRGVLIDPVERQLQIQKHEGTYKRLDKYLQRLSWAIGKRSLNYNSPAQIQEFFYEVMGLPKQYKYEKGKRRVTCDRKALEKLETYYYARPIVKCIMALKDTNEVLKVLRKGIDRDGRMRCSFNVAGTETGRWSSQKNPQGGGTNFQNITEELRPIFLPDDGYKFAYPDLKQAESRGVAYLSGDENYIEAVESGNVHVAVARMLWPELPWNGDLKKDKEIALRPFYRHFSHYDMSKRGGHATNYLGTAAAVALALGIEKSIVQEFQELYFSTFPGIPRWHMEVQKCLEVDGFVDTPIGRRRYFFGRRTSRETLKEAVAHIPQSMISDICKIGQLRIWRELDLGTRGQGVQLLGDVHDGFLCQFRTPLASKVIPRMIELMRVEVPIKGRVLVIPVDFDVGFRWYKGKLRSDGMVPWDSPSVKTQVRPDILESAKNWVL